MLVDAGRLYMLKVLTGQLAVETIRMGLYSNAVAWSRATLLTGLTELSNAGYARQDVTGWGTPTSLATGEGDVVANQVTFSNTSASAAVAKGFFYVTTTTNVFLGGDAFAADLTIPATIGTLGIYPELQDSTYP